MNSHYSHNTAPIILQDEQIRALLPQLDVQQELTDMFCALGQYNAVQPAQSLTILPDNAGDFINYMGAMQEAGVFGSKLSPYLVTTGNPIITAWTCLMSLRTGHPLLWCDSALLTTERTAGTTALAVDYLAKTTSSRLAIIGSGAVALAHLRHTKTLRPWQSIHVYSPSLGDNQQRRQAFIDIDDRVIFCHSMETCIEDADVILLCTSSGTPVIELAALTKPALITSISTNLANAHEVPPALLSDADVYCDYKATTPTSAGEMCLAAEQGWSVDDIRGDLGELVTGNCAAPDHSKPIFFRSIGLGLEDIAMAYGVWKLLQTK